MTQRVPRRRLNLVSGFKFQFCSMRNVAVRIRFGQEIALPEIPFEKLKRHPIDSSSRSGIVPRSLVTHKCVSTVEFMLAEYSISIGQGVVDDSSSLARHMRILAAKNDQQ